MFYFDLDLKKLVARPGYPDPIRSVTHKRGDGDSVLLSFCRGAVPAQIGTPTEMVYVVKVDFEELTEPLVLANTGDWTLDVDSGIWSAPLSSDSAAILLLLDGAEMASAKAEFTFTDENGGPSTSQTLTANLYNDLWKGTEGTPLSLATPEAWLDARAVRFDAVQALTGPEKAQAQANIGLPKANYTATTPPDPLTDDSTQGYSVGSPWFDTVGKEGYRCVDATVGDAVWIESTFDGAEVAAMIAAVTDQLFDGSGGYVALALDATNALYPSGTPNYFFGGSGFGMEAGALEVNALRLDVLFNGVGHANNAIYAGNANYADYGNYSPNTFFGSAGYAADNLEVAGYQLAGLFDLYGSVYYALYSNNSPNNFFTSSDYDAGMLKVNGYELDDILTGNGAAYYAEYGYVDPNNFFSGAGYAADQLTVGGYQLGFFMDNGDGRVNGTYFKEGGYDGGTVTTAYTVDLTLGSIHAIALTAGAACAVTMPAVVVGVSFTVEVKQAATPTGTCAFTGAAWIGNVTPTQTAIANRVDRYVFTANVAGTAWVGTAAQNSVS